VRRFGCGYLVSEGDDVCHFIELCSVGRYDAAEKLDRAALKMSPESGHRCSAL